MITRMKSFVVTLGLAATLMASAATNVSGSPSTPDSASQATAVESVLGSSNPQAKFASLSARDQAAFTESLNHLTTTSTTTGGPIALTPAEQLSMTQGSVQKISVGGASVNATAPSAGAGCWQVYHATNYYDLAVQTGQTWMQLNWCGKSGKITSWKLLTAGGIGMHGMSYNGVKSKQTYNAGYEIRYSVAFDFSLTWAHFYPCEQTRGGATGLYSTPLNKCVLS